MAKGLDRDAWLALLERPFPFEARAPFLDEVRALDSRIDALSLAGGPPAIDATTLARARLVGSHSLRKGHGDDARRRDLEAWAVGNALVASFVSEDAPLTLERLAKLNGALRGSPEPSRLRWRPIHLGAYRCPDAEDLPALLAPMLEAVEARIAEVHPIAGAALVQQWLVSIHAFEDANGRTSRLAADWILAQHGYPPASYPDLISSLTAIIDHGREPLDVVGTATILVRGIDHTLSLLTGP